MNEWNLWRIKEELINDSTDTKVSHLRKRERTTDLVLFRFETSFNTPVGLSKLREDRGKFLLKSIGAIESPSANDDERVTGQFDLTHKARKLSNFWADLCVFLDLAV